MNKKEREIKEISLEVLEKVLYDFENIYTWEFRGKLKKSINKLQKEIIDLESGK